MTISRRHLRRVVAEVFECPAESLQPDTKLRDLPTYDSVNVLSLMVAIEEECKIEIMPDELAALATLTDIESLAVRRGAVFED